MPERHAIFQENATPRAETAFASAELPTVESIFARSGSLQAKACRSVPCLRVVLAALASITAVALLVSFCSRVYARHHVRYLGGRRLASSEDSNASVDVCGLSSDDEEKKQQDTPPTANSEDGNEAKLPFKKRKLARAVESGAGGGERDAQQQEQQQTQQQQPHHATAADMFVPISTQAAPWSDQLGPSRFPFPAPQYPAQMGTVAELDAATGVPNLAPRQHDVGYSAAGTREAVTLDGWQMQQELLWRERPFWQLHPHLGSTSPHRQHQQEHLHRQHYFQHELKDDQQHMNWMHLSFQQQHQQQSLLHQQGPQHGPPVHEEQQVMQHGQQQAMWQEEREERHREEKRRRQAKQELWREEQPLLLQPSYRLSGPSQEDEWIAPDSPKPEAPQPSTSQQAFHFSAPATVADTTTSDGISTQGGWGFPGGPPATYLAATHAGASWGNAASAVGGRAPLGSSIAFRYSGGLPRPGAWMTTGEPTMGALSGSLAHAIANGARAQEAAERAAAAAAAGLRSSIPASLSSPATIRLLRKPCIVSTSVMNHPFVRLPTRIVDETETPVAIDLEKATMHARKIRCAVPLLREAHELLSHGSLTTAQSKQLALVAGELIERAMHYEHQDQSLKKTSRAVVRLGIRFLLLDTVVSALMVLGQEPDAGYWKIITDAIDHNAPLFAERAGFIQRTTYYLRLCHDLSNALQILKKGKRPAPEELLRIKQMLLCSPLSPAPFKGEDFEPWRVDNSRANSRP